MHWRIEGTTKAALTKAMPLLLVFALLLSATPASVRMIHFVFFFTLLFVVRS